jgi:VanZ family protein
MKKILKYWIPPLLWMAFIFPVGNKALSSPFLWRLNQAFWRWLIPDVDESLIDIVYIIIRKSLHFIEFAFLAFLLYRGFRKDSKTKWNLQWATYAGSMGIGYGFLDEFIQSFMASRNGSLIDCLFDTAGVLFALGIIYWKREKSHIVKE